jgi:hypothetical protein
LNNFGLQSNIDAVKAAGLHLFTADAATVAMPAHKLIAAPKHVLVADTYAVLTLAQCREIKAAGYWGLKRYLDNLTRQQIADAFTAGLAVGLLTSCRGTGWIPSAPMGALDGQAASAKLDALGVMPGSSIDGDVEGQGGVAADLLAYLEARGKVCVSRKDIPSSYFGWSDAKQLATGQQLNDVVDLHGYWACLSQCCPRPNCTWNLIQLNPGNEPIAGTLIDTNVVQPDARGRTPIFIAAA